MSVGEQAGGQTGVKHRRIFYGWYIVAAGMGIHLWISLAWIYGMQVFFTPLTAAFGWSRTALSFAFSLQRLEGSIIQPIEGFLVDRYGPRKLVVSGVAILGAGLFALSYLETVGSIWMFYGVALVVSIGTSASVGIPRNWAIVQWFRRLRGRALGIGATGAVVSGPLLFILVWMVESFGLMQSFRILGVATWVLCLPLAMVYRGRPQQYGYLPDGDPPKEAPSEAASGDAPQSVAPDEGSGSLTVKEALRTPAFWILTLVFGAQTMGVSGLMVHLIPYFESIGFTTAQAASVLAYFTVLSTIGRLGGGWAMDMFDRRLVLAGLLACQSIAFLIMANITAYWMVFPFALLYGIAFGGMMPSRAVIISSYFGTRHFGAIQGLSQSATVLSGVVAPVLLGGVFDLTGSYSIAIYIVMGITAAVIPLTILARPPWLPAAAQEAPTM